MYKIAIVGAGNMAFEHAKAINEINGLNLVGVYSRSSQKAQRFSDELNIDKVCDSISALYLELEPDLVIIAVNEESFVEIIDEVLEYSWKILAEKPVGLGFDEFAHIQDKIRSLNKDLYVAMNRRNYPSTLAVKSEIDLLAGKRFINILDHQDINTYKNLHFSNKTYKYWMYKNSIHLLDYFIFLGRSNIESVEVIQAYDERKLNSVIAHIQYENADEGLYTGVWHGPGPWSVSVTHPDKYFLLAPLEEAKYRINESYKMLDLKLPSCLNDIFKPGIFEQAKEILKMLQGKEANLPRFEDYCQTVNLLYQVYGV
ncbi:MAG: Gfo/Idh/MocA family oxidoreductase [Alphaproteobacteria bacterium]|nr:MAG: Gfo/Idh/MocA family oxidoreductase [Alphaproteobacteria bacterium]